MGRGNGIVGRRFRWLIFAPALFFVIADRANAESYALECREVEADWSDEPVYWCKRDWFSEGSRITDEQRKTVNAAIVATVIIPLSSRRR